MQYIGELISLVVSVLWTISALASEVGSKHLGVYVLRFLNNFFIIFESFI